MLLWLVLILWLTCCAVLGHIEVRGYRNNFVRYMVTKRKSTNLPLSLPTREVKGIMLCIVIKITLSMCQQMKEVWQVHCLALTAISWNSMSAVATGCIISNGCGGINSEMSARLVAVVTNCKYQRRRKNYALLRIKEYFIEAVRVRWIHSLVKQCMLLVNLSIISYV